MYAYVLCVQTVKQFFEAKRIKRWKRRWWWWWREKKIRPMWNQYRFRTPFVGNVCLWFARVFVFFFVRIVWTFSLMLMIMYGYHRVPYACMQTFLPLLALSPSPFSPSISESSAHSMLPKSMIAVETPSNTIKIHGLQMQMIPPRVSVIFPAGNFR